MQVNRMSFAAVLVFLCISCNVFGVFGGGSGTAEDPYLIYIKDQLLDSRIVLGTDYVSHFKLMADIDFQGQPCPTLFSQYRLRGSFDGNSKRIKNITMGNQQGFIAGLNSGAILKNLTLDRPVLVNTTSSGALLAYVNGGTIDHCHIVEGEINWTAPDDYMASSGLTGYNFGTIKNSTFSGIIRATHAAGIANFNSENGIIETSFASVQLYASVSAGGLACNNYGLIRNCSTRGRIENQGVGWNYTGGLVGYNSGVQKGSVDYFDAAVYGDGGGIILDSYSGCEIIAQGKGIGGLVGTSWSGAIRNCYASGSVRGHSYIGGLTGTIQNCVGDSIYSGFKYKGIIARCYAMGNVSGDNRIGGLAGENASSEIRNSYSTGSVTGNSVAGGLVGNVYIYPYAGGGNGFAVVDRCYSTGKVIGGTQTGGLIGKYGNGGPQRVVNSFWDTQTSGWTTSIQGIGRTTAQMMTQSTFTNWDFVNTWHMNGYPVLKWEINPIQARIDAAADGDTIVVEPGLYEGRLYFKGKNITLTSRDPLDPEIVASTILRGRGIGPVVTFQGTETPDCVLQGFTIEGGYAAFPGGGGVYGGPTASAAATVRNCIIQKNRTSDYGGGIGGFKGLISNCIIRNNSGKYGGGLSWCDGTIENCLIVNNTASTAGNAIYRCNQQIKNCTVVSDRNLSISQVDFCAGSIMNSIFYGQDNVFSACTGVVSYCRYPMAVGTGNISDEPLFVDLANGDYRLLPESLCLNAGDPQYVPSIDETDLDGQSRVIGSRIDMGAYEFPNTQPVANAGADASIHCKPDGIADVTLDGSGSSDIDGDTLSYKWSWTIEGTEYTAEGPTPTIQLPLGTYTIALIVNDGIFDSESDEVVMTVYNTAPVADAGMDQTVYAWIDGNASVTLDGTGSSDTDGDSLTYSWILDGEVIATESMPTITLPVGIHTVTLTVSDGIEESESDGVVITVVAARQTALKVVPMMINRKSRMPEITALLELPAGVDALEGTVALYPGGIECRVQSVVLVDGKLTLCALFNKEAVITANPADGATELTVVGKLPDGPYVYGRASVRIIK